MIKLKLFEDWNFEIDYLNILNESFNENDLDSVLNLISSWLTDKLNKKVVYNKNFENVLQNENIELNCVRFFTEDLQIFRLNWKGSPNSQTTKIYSVDFWLGGDVNHIPNYTLDAEKLNIVQILTLIYGMLNDYSNNHNTFKNNIKDTYVSNYVNVEKLLEESVDESIVNSDVVDSVIKQNNVFVEKDVSNLGKMSDKEFADIVEKELDLDDKFKDLKFLIASVVNGVDNSLIITGTPGVGKTYTVETTLKEMGLVENRDYVMVTGKASPMGVYQQFFYWRKNKVIVFDDCDDVLKNPEGVDIFKGALDTKPVRNISWPSRNTFDSKDKTDIEIQNIVEKTGKMPSSFQVDSTVIFISNMEYDKLITDDLIKALISRSRVADMVFTEEELIEYMKKILPNINIDFITQEDKRLVFDVMLRASKNGYLKLPINIRTFIKMAKAKVAATLLGNTDEKYWIRIAVSYS